MLPKRPLKSSKGYPPPGDMVALGSSKRLGSETDLKSLASSSQSRSSAGMKRDPLSAGTSSLLVKKPKMMTQTFTPLGRHNESERRGSPTTQVYLYDEIAKEVDAVELLRRLTEAADNEDDNRVEALLCGGVKHLKHNRSKPDTAVYLTLMYLAKTRPSLFTASEIVIEAFSSLLKRGVSLNFKAKGNPLVAVAAVNILMAAFQDEENWPDNFVKVYFDDALGERVWVDRPDCKTFVENIQTAFNTKRPKVSMVTADLTTKSDSTSTGASPMAFNIDDEDNSLSCYESYSKLASEDDQAIKPFPRYIYEQVSMESYVRETLNRRLTNDVPSRSLLRVMTSTCGYSEVRTMAAQRLEMWIQNPKLTKPAQDLLMAVCLNCDQHSQQDIEVMSQVAKIRLKTKPLINHYLLCIRELVIQHAENLKTLMQHTIYNELSPSRNPNNMSLIGIVFNVDSTKAAAMLAEIFQDLLLIREDYLRPLRALMREVVKSVRADFMFSGFALGLMKERSEGKFKDLDSQVKDRFLTSLTDLIALTALLSVSPQVKDVAAAVARGDKKDVDVLHQYQTQVAEIQRDAVWWLHTIVPNMVGAKPNDYIHCLRKVLFLEKPESYHKVDSWPSDSDRSLLLRLVSEVPVMEDTLMRVLIMGLTRDLHVPPTDAVDIADQLVRRAALLQAPDFLVLQVERIELIDALLNLCAYKHPENIVLPKGYQPPSLAIAALYWKAWLLLLILSSFNPSTFGLRAWEHYPTLKCFMEMCMTGSFKFPPPTMASDDKAVEEIKTRDKQMSEVEKQQILEFEGYLAAASSKTQITEDNSHLLAQLILIEPSAFPRRPPPGVLEQLKSLNHSLRIGHLLYRSRSPDFLLDIIQRQGTSQSMPWLAELVESSESSLDVLPVQCLCEFLLHEPSHDAAPTDHSSDDSNKAEQKQRKQQQLLVRLQNLLYNKASDMRAVAEVLGYFFNRLSSQQASTRHLAVKGLAMVLARGASEEDSPMDTEITQYTQAIPSHSWLLEQLPTLPHFSNICSQTCVALREACQMETDSAAVSAYIIFLSLHTADMQLQDLSELALDLAKLIVERTTLLTQLLPQPSGLPGPRPHLVLAAMLQLFHNYLTRTLELDHEAIPWSNTQDQILLQWESGKSATMNVLVVHAMIILLTYGKPSVSSIYEEMLETWFPEQGAMPSAFLVDTSEEALLLPDWLKLHMIRSSSLRLVEAALVDLEPSQLLLFVQSFGIPVASMSQLLRCLDEAVALDPTAMERVVVDKGYMAQLVDVQYLRGARGGERFHAMLKQDNEQEKSDTAAPVCESMSSPSVPKLERAEPLPATSYSTVDDVLALLLQLFDIKDKLCSSEKSPKYRAFLKALSKHEVVVKTVAALNKILQTGQKEMFVSALKKNIHHSAPIVRLLIAKKSYALADTQALLQDLSIALGDSKSALVQLVQSQLGGGSVGQLLVTSLKGQLENSDLATTLHTLSRSGGPVKEQLINQQIDRCLHSAPSSAQSASLTEAISSLLQDTSHREELTSTRGLLIDWLKLLDPEVLHSCPQHQKQLLFAENKDQPTGNKAQARPLEPYLLALLTHQSSWSTVHRCLDLLLNHDMQNFQPTSVLDFIYACIHIPRIWKGRDRNLPKNYIPEDIFALKEDQVHRLVDYIILEALPLTSDNKSDGVTTGSQFEHMLTARAVLLIRCCCRKRHLVGEVVNCLNKRLRQCSSGEAAVCQQLLLQVYMHAPDVVDLLGQSISIATAISTSQVGRSQMDAVLHRIITTLGNAAHGKQAENRMYDANIACKKLAARHPILVLRHLPLLAALLQGRVHFTIGEIKHRNHLLLFTNVLGVLDLLQPYIFHPQYTPHLLATIQPYTDLIQIHGMRNKNLASITIKFVKLLHNYMADNATLASKNLQVHVPLLNELLSQYPDLPTLRSLLAGLTLPRKDDSEEQSAPQSQQLTSDLPAVRPTSPWNLSQLAPYLYKIAKGSSTEDVHDVLRDLDETSKRKVDVLQHFTDDLRRLLSDGNETCRNMSHNLVMRYLRQEPSCAGDFVPTFLQCLTHSSLDVVQCALKHLPEFVLLAQEYAQTLLLKAFQVGVLMKVETSNPIVEALQLLNMETMT